MSDKDRGQHMIFSTIVSQVAKKSRVVVHLYCKAKESKATNAAKENSWPQ